MDVGEVLRRRRMVRSFTPDPLPAGALGRILDHARRSPSAGHTQGWAFLVLEGREETGRYWAATLPPEARARFPWPGLLRAPVLVVPCVSATAYLERYAEADKSGTGLAAGVSAWRVPYWYVDGGMATMAILCSVVDEGLGACFFGLFDREDAVRAAFGIPPDHQPIGTVAIGHPAPDRQSRSLARGRRPVRDVVRRGGW